MDHTDFNQKLKALLNINFTYLRVTREFTAWTSFSETRLQLTSNFNDHFGRTFRLCHLVDQKKLEVALSNNWRKLENIAALSSNLKYDSKQPEYEVVEEVSEVILLPFVPNKRGA